MEINLSEHDIIPFKILYYPDQLKIYLTNSDSDEPYIALFQSVESMVSPESQATIFTFINDLSVRDIGGWTYLDHLSELYWSAYEQIAYAYPDPKLEQLGYEGWIRAAVDFGFEVTERSRDYVRRTGNVVLAAYLDEMSQR